MRSFLRLIKLSKLVVCKLDLSRGSPTQFHGVLDHGLNLHWNIPLNSAIYLHDTVETQLVFTVYLLTSWLFGQSQFNDWINDCVQGLKGSRGPTGKSGHPGPAGLPGLTGETGLPGQGAWQQGGYRLTKDFARWKVETNMTINTALLPCVKWKSPPVWTDYSLCHV